MSDEIKNDYFGWLYNLACKRKCSGRVSYKKLLTHLHSKDFTYLISRDANRAEDGVSLRYRYADDRGHISAYTLMYTDLDFPCTVLEMMLGLAVKCEETIMDDARIGDRTAQWFWGMIVNLGLGSMTDDNYDKITVDKIIDRFLDREYEPDGRGGLFTIKNCDCDLRDVEIWYQLCWYLDNIA